jgi:hypothetical protein
MAGAAKLDQMLEATTAWYRAQPDNPEARNWLSQALYSRALHRDHLRLPCEPSPVYIDRGPPPGETAAAAMVRDGRERAQLGYDHILTSAASKIDAEAALCFADLAAGEPFAFTRGLRILIDLARDSELRARARAAAAGPSPDPELSLSDFLMEYLVDDLGLRREQEAAELLLVIRELGGASPRVETARAAIVLQVSAAADAPDRAKKEAWLAEHGFNQRWWTPPPAKKRGKSKR